MRARSSLKTPGIAGCCSGLAELLRKRFQSRRSTVDGSGEGSASMAREDDDAPATNGSGGPGKGFELVWA